MSNVEAVTHIFEKYEYLSKFTMFQKCLPDRVVLIKKWAIEISRIDHKNSYLNDIFYTIENTGNERKFTDIHSRRLHDAIINIFENCKDDVFAHTVLNQLARLIQM